MVTTNIPMIQSSFSHFPYFPWITSQTLCLSVSYKRRRILTLQVRTVFSVTFADSIIVDRLQFPRYIPPPQYLKASDCPFKRYGICGFSPSKCLRSRIRTIQIALSVSESRFTLLHRVSEGAFSRIGSLFPVTSIPRNL